MESKGLIWNEIEQNEFIHYDPLVTLIKSTLAPNNHDMACKVEDDVNKAMAEMFRNLEEKYMTPYLQKKKDMIRTFRKELVKMEGGYAFSKSETNSIMLTYCGEKQREYVMDVYLDDDDVIVVHTKFDEGGNESEEWTKLSDFSNDEIEEIIKLCLKPRKEYSIQMGEEVDWITKFGVYARNRDSRIYENTTKFPYNAIVVIYDWHNNSYDENDVANDLANAVNYAMWDGEDYTLYNEQHQLVGYVFQKVEEK